MLDAVRALKIPGSAPSIAAVGTGFLAAAALRLSTDLFAAGPLACAVAAALGLVGATARVSTRRAAVASAALGVALAAAAFPAARALAWLGGFGGLPALTLAYGLALVALAGAPLGRAAARGGRSAPILAAASFAVAAWLPTWAIVGSVLASGLLTITLEPYVSSPVTRAPPARHLAGTILAFPVVGGALLAWSLARAPLDPTPLGFTALAAGALVGVGLAVSRWAALPGLALVGAVAFAVTQRLPDVLAQGPHAGALAFGAGGLGAGLLLGALRPTLPDVAAATSLAALLLPAALARVPAPVAAWAARAETTTQANRARVAALRERATVAFAGVGATGATALLRRDPNVLAEVDGDIADPATRAGAAERFAGTLAACATDGRARARVGGDDLGLAVEALRAQSFLAIDTAVPDRGFGRAQADARPSLARAWLHPSVRLVALPAPAVLRAGPPADVVVEIVRAPWTDGRRTFPAARDLAATRATLAPGGAHVLALSATTLPDDALPAVVADFLAVYPGASLWLPPQGADTALLLGTVDGAPIPWERVERCVAADRDALVELSVRSPVDLGALALADATSLAALPAGRRVGPGLPASLHAAPRIALAGLGTLDADPARLFTGAPAELAGLGASRALLLDMLREAARGDVRDATARARELARTPGGARALEPVLAPHLDRARQAMARAAREGLASKAWEDAETALATARALAPRHAQTLCLEGELAGARGQLPRAEEAFAACAGADPTSVAAYDGLARARRSRGDLAGTEEALRSALRVGPNSWTTAQNLGFFLLENGRLEEAERMLKQAAATQSRDGGTLAPAPYLALARLYLETQRPELALAQAERAVGLGGGANALAYRGAARYELRQLDMAEEDFRAALAATPTHVLARYGLGQIQASRGEYELAAASFRAVVEADPQFADAREKLGRLARLVSDAPE